MAVSEGSREQLSVLMVCTGNICRSPAAERLARHHWGADELTVTSAGTGALVGQPINLSMRHLLLLDAVDTDDFEARMLTEPMVRDAELVLGMAIRHRQAVVQLHPPALRRTFTLLEFARLAEAAAPSLTGPTQVKRLHEILATVPDHRVAGRPVTDDIVDPYGHGTDVYDKSHAAIKGAVLAIGRALTPR